MTWKKGDRALVVPSESWLQPTRKLAAEGRPVTILSATSIMGREAFYVAFDVKRARAQPHKISVYPRELLPLPEESA